MRVKKTVDGAENRYYYSNGMLMWMCCADGTAILFFYDQFGRPFAMYYDDLLLFYILNQQGDVVKLVDRNGISYGAYRYDAWGNIIQQSDNEFARNNPLRYRGYVYDEETELYYCNSRYYDPAVGRWINADAYATTGQGFVGNNMFAYCLNNPIMYTDSLGMAPTWWQWTLSGIMVVGGIVLVATGGGSPLGGALICAGVNSIINSYVYENADGSSTAGWLGGMTTGAINGYGAGAAGNLLMSATKATGTECIKAVAAGIGVAFGSGAMGSAAGTAVAAGVDGKKLKMRDLATTAIVGGTLNVVAGITSGMGSAIATMPGISETTQSTASFLSTGWAIISEAFNDALNVITSLFQ